MKTLKVLPFLAIMVLSGCNNNNFTSGSSLPSGGQKLDVTTEETKNTFTSTINSALNKLANENFNDFALNITTEIDEYMNSIEEKVDGVVEKETTKYSDFSIDLSVGANNFVSATTIAGLDLSIDVNSLKGNISTEKNNGLLNYSTKEKILDTTLGVYLKDSALYANLTNPNLLSTIKSFTKVSMPLEVAGTSDFETTLSSIDSLFVALTFESKKIKYDLTTYKFDEQQISGANLVESMFSGLPINGELTTLYDTLTQFLTIKEYEGGDIGFSIDVNKENLPIYRRLIGDPISEEELNGYKIYNTSQGILISSTGEIKQISMRNNIRYTHKDNVITQETLDRNYTVVKFIEPQGAHFPTDLTSYKESAMLNSVIESMMQPSIEEGAN